MEELSSAKSRDRFRIWLLQAKFDLEIAQISFENNYYEWACYQSVQAVEKALKSVLVHAGWRSPKTHKLGVLVSMANHANKLFVNIKLNFRKIEAYTFISRYPFVYPGRNVTPHDLITKQDAETCLSLAQNIYTSIETFLQENRVEKGEVIKTDDYYFDEAEIKNRIDDMVKDITSDSKLNPSKIILFGTFAREKIVPMSSTMDILVIAETDIPFIERIKYVRELTHGNEPIIEPLVYTQAEFDYMLNEEGEGFIESAIDEGRVVYDRDLGQVGAENLGGDTKTVVNV